MPHKVVIKVKCVLIVGSFLNRWNWSIYRYYPIYLYIANMSRGLSGVQYQQTFLMGLDHEHPKEYVMEN